MADLSPQLWRRARIEEIREETSHIKTFRLKLDEPYTYEAGQHCSVQVHTASGHTLARDYSFSSAPASGNLELTIARMPQGELSSWFTELAAVGDTVEISPAVGSSFRWTIEQPEPILLIGGGVGVAPLMSMIREHTISTANSPMQLLYSCRNYEDICFKKELLGSSNTLITLTNLSLLPENWLGEQGRLGEDFLHPFIVSGQTIYVCGSNAFVHDMTNLLIQLGTPVETIRRELFG